MNEFAKARGFMPVVAIPLEAAGKGSGSKDNILDVFSLGCCQKCHTLHTNTYILAFLSIGQFLKKVLSFIQF